MRRRREGWAQLPSDQQQLLETAWWEIERRQRQLTAESARLAGLKQHLGYLDKAEKQEMDAESRVAHQSKIRELARTWESWKAWTAADLSATEDALFDLEHHDLADEDKERRRDGYAKAAEESDRRRKQFAGNNWFSTITNGHWVGVEEDEPRCVVAFTHAAGFRVSIEDIWFDDTFDSLDEDTQGSTYKLALLLFVRALFDTYKKGEEYGNVPTIVFKMKAPPRYGGWANARQGCVVKWLRGFGFGDDGVFRYVRGAIRPKSWCMTNDMIV
tara:strand:+ start:4898 stop:5713 length:816 start_codon:yes stop_codon:yes gene_type:complete